MTECYMKPVRGVQQVAEQKPTGRQKDTATISIILHLIFIIVSSFFFLGFQWFVWKYFYFYSGHYLASIGVRSSILSSWLFLKITHTNVFADSSHVGSLAPFRIVFRWFAGGEVGCTSCFILMYLPQVPASLITCPALMCFTGVFLLFPVFWPFLSCLIKDPVTISLSVQSALSPSLCAEQG